MLDELSTEEPRIRRVLLVDDNPTNLQVLYQALERENYELLIALSGEEALEIAAAAQPQLILLDINMPGMDGFETCQRLKADPLTKEQVIIFLSASSQLKDKVRGLQLGAVDYISKPFEFEEVVMRVHTQIELLESRQELQRLQQESDRLLRNILPDSIVSRLKRGEETPVDSISAATIIFADLVDFTPLAASTEPHTLVSHLNRVFSVMDELADKHGLEKIKTIGDAYMAAAGVPTPREDHAQAVAHFALDLISALDRQRDSHPLPVDLRIGIHSGPVVAGVIGKRKFAYDLWGDTVNVASRMEASSQKNRIQLTTATHALLTPGFQMEARGPISIKGLGTIETYFLTGETTPLT